MNKSLVFHFIRGDDKIELKQVDDPVFKITCNSAVIYDKDLGLYCFLEVMQQKPTITEDNYHLFFQIDSDFFEIRYELHNVEARKVASFIFDSLPLQNCEQKFGQKNINLN